MYQLFAIITSFLAIMGCPTERPSVDYVEKYETLKTDPLDFSWSTTAKTLDEFRQSSQYRHGTPAERKVMIQAFKLYLKSRGKNNEASQNLANATGSAVDVIID